MGIRFVVSSLSAIWRKAVGFLCSALCAGRHKAQGIEFPEIETALDCLGSRRITTFQDSVFL